MQVNLLILAPLVTHFVDLTFAQYVCHGPGNGGDDTMHQGTDYNPCDYDLGYQQYLKNHSNASLPAPVKPPPSYDRDRNDFGLPPSNYNNNDCGSFFSFLCSPKTPNPGNNLPSPIIPVGGTSNSTGNGTFAYPNNGYNSGNLKKPNDGYSLDKMPHTDSGWGVQGH